MSSAAIDALAIAQGQREERQRLSIRAWRIRRAMARDVRLSLVVTAEGAEERHTGYVVESGRKKGTDFVYVVLAERPRARDRGAELWRGRLDQVVSIERPPA